MPNINVTVYDSTENKRVPVELPDDAPCNKIVAVLVQKLAAADEWSRRSSAELQVSPQELRSTNSGHANSDGGQVQDGDILRLQPEITAGSGSISHNTIV